MASLGQTSSGKYFYAYVYTDGEMIHFFLPDL